jgi:hypothetical protein
MKQQIESCLINFIKNDFQQNPQDFFNEEDVRAVLFTRLKDSFKSVRREFPFEPINRQLESNPINTDLIKCEYSYEDYQGKYCKTFDIAVLHEEKNIWIAKQIWETYHTGKSRQAQMYWNQPIRFGIEIKSAWHKWDINSRIAGTLSDRQKLNDYFKSDYCDKHFKDSNGNFFQFESLAILFVSHPILKDNRLTPVKNISLTNPSTAYCVTPTELFEIN